MRRDDAVPARVLLVDDSRFDRELAAQALEGVGALSVCDSGEAALALLTRESVDLVVSDLQMPGLSGVELLERVRTAHPETDFMLLTGYASVDSAVAALRMGAVDYLTKPVRPERLRHTVLEILRRRQLRRENQKLRQDLKTVEACRALTPCLDSGDVYAVALDLLLERLSRDRGVSIFHRTSVPKSDAVAFRGIGEAESGRLRGALIDDKPLDLSGYARVELVSEGPLHTGFARAGVSAGPVLSVPVTGLEGEAGVIWLFEDGRPFEPEEIARARVVASHARASLLNAERYNHAKERAFIDDVTEIYNARYLLQTADNEIRRAERYHTPLSVLFIDLDRFKLVNDRYGHLVGSQTLRHLSQLLLECVRGVDTLARYGGDEFTILLVDTVHEQALAVAERIRHGVAEHVFEAGPQASLRLTLSAGVATYPEHGRQRDALLDAADKAMYRAKSLGRNRICSAAALTTPREV